MKFFKSHKNKQLTEITGATTIPPIGDSLLYMEASVNIFGSKLCDGFEGIDNKQIKSIIFYYIRFPNPASNAISMGWFRNHLLVPNGQRQSNYINEKILTRAPHQQNGL